MKAPLVSVNVRTYNSAKTLNATLLSVSKQTYSKIEIVVSDGHSVDGSLDIAKKFKARINYSDNLGDARFKNYKKSNGKYIISLDSDQVMDKKLIERCVYICENENFDALIISEKSLPGKGSTLEKIISFDKFVIDVTRDDDVTFGTACPRFFRKSLLKGVKWPKKLGIFDDTILYSQLKKRGARVKYISDVSIRHQEVADWWTLIRKFHRYGKSFPIAIRENPTTIAGHALPRRSYFSGLVLSKPLFLCGLLFLYSVKALAASTGVIAYYLEKFLVAKPK